MNRCELLTVYYETYLRPIALLKLSNRLLIFLENEKNCWNWGESRRMCINDEESIQGQGWEIGDEAKWIAELDVVAWMLDACCLSERCRFQENEMTNDWVVVQYWWWTHTWLVLIRDKLVLILPKEQMVVVYACHVVVEKKEMSTNTLWCKPPKKRFYYPFMFFTIYQ